MHYIHIETTDGESRWLNLAQVSRVTSAFETGTDIEIIVVFFADGEAESTLRLRGSTDQDRAAIQVLKSHLEALTREACAH